MQLRTRKNTPTLATQLHERHGRTRDLARALLDDSGHNRACKYERSLKINGVAVEAQPWLAVIHLIPKMWMWISCFGDVIEAYQISVVWC